MEAALEPLGELHVPGNRALILIAIQIRLGTGEEPHDIVCEQLVPPKIVLGEMAP